MDLKDIFEVNHNFTRSINIVEDLNSSESADNYVWTESNFNLLEKISSYLTQNKNVSSFSLTGPFGTGKSAFTLQLLQLMGCAGKKTQENSYSKFNNFRKATETSKTLKSFTNSFPLVITGKQTSFKNAICEGILQSLLKEKCHRLGVYKKLERIIEEKQSETVSIPELLIELSSSLATKGYSSIIFIIDEFGKLLEYSALHPSKSDVYVLQEIAEIRPTKLKTNLLFLNILHQSFEGYARHLSEQSRNEWVKIQGRFINLNISEKPEELVSLALSSIDMDNAKRGSQSHLSKIVAKRRKQFEDFKDLNIFKTLLSKKDTNNAFYKSYPFNPLALYILPFLSKIAGQNSRSTFTFLGSDEPFSFNQFLQAEHELEEPEITVDWLYDYFTATTSTMMNSQVSRRWTEVAVALARVDDNYIFEKRLLKVIGILNALQLNKLFPANKELLQLAFLDKPEEDIEQSLDFLAEKKIILYRKFSNEYRIWEGSDFSIEEEMSKRLNQMAEQKELVGTLSKMFPQQNIIANRHFEETGTLRFASIHYCNSSQLEDLDSIKNSAEAKICLVVCFDNDEYKEASALAKKLSSDSQYDNYIFYVSTPNNRLFSCLQEYICLEDIRDTTHSLLHDPVALKEIKDRIIESEDEMSILLNNTFWNFTENYQIYDSGSFRTLKNSKALRALISERFDKIYPKTPVTKNELLNRYKVSGSVNRACKLVCFNMAKKVTERDIKKNPELGDKLDSPLYLGSVDLGLTGTSAEATIFRLMYQKSGLYSERAGGEFNFGAPTETSWIPFWEEVNAFINARAGEDIQVVEIISHFEQKPFGMRRPIIIMALIALLKMQNTGIAVFNENTYEPELTEIVLELFLRQPKHFAIRKNRDLETRNLVLEVFFQGFFPKLNFDEHKADAVFMIVKEIYRSFRILPAYANQTRSVSENARNIRNVLIRANRPEELLFTDLPKALGFEENLKDNANKYVCSLKDTLSELVNALGNLKEKASKELFDRFKLPPKATLTDVREELGPRCDVVSQLTDDAYIKNFASKGHNTIYLDDKWLDVLLGAIASKPLTSWNDVDEKDFPNKLATLYRSFSNYELLKQEFIQQNDAIENAPQSDKKTTPVATAVTITTAGSKELQSVIGKYIDSDEVTLLKEQLKNTLGNNHHSVKEAALVSLLKEVIH